ncbi:endonuclease/exonuclease/phosphatase family protein [Parabacteroides sp. An277]|uniref:endonuclease/exonuclease/phosphatase family protein n=1 Tax=Parabacteroides sp. An277 TaxID=1965619 RepID=UPI0011243DEC|nr:endonuclease/exonuclease/phosphatase family protein [Parabacteroides sp. An277]
MRNHKNGIGLFRIACGCLFILSVLSYTSRFVSGWISLCSLIFLPVALLNLACAGIACCLKPRKWTWLSLTGFLLHVGNLHAIYQFPKGKTNEAEGIPLTVVIYNTHNFYNGKSYLPEAMAYIDGLDADIFCTQEGPVPEFISEDTIQKYFSDWKYRYMSTEAGYSSVSIFSRYPIQKVEPIYYDTIPAVTLIADIEVEGKIIRLLNNHLQTTSVNLYRDSIQNPIHEKSRIEAMNQLLVSLKDNFQRRAKQADRIRDEIEKSPYPVIVCGDFNDTPASYTYRRIKGNLVDGFIEVGNGYQYTFRQLKRLWRIDYILHSKEFRGTECYSPDLPYSDHNMVVWKGKIREEKEIR